MEMFSRILTKKDTQAAIKELRSIGVTVDKIESGYVATYQGEVIFKAMNGHRGYLVRMAKGIFKE